MAKYGKCTIIMTLFTTTGFTSRKTVKFRFRNGNSYKSAQKNIVMLITFVIDNICKLINGSDRSMARLPRYFIRKFTFTEHLYLISSTRGRPIESIELQRRLNLNGFDDDSGAHAQNSGLHLLIIIVTNSTM